jgi:hypothetical protein
MTSDQQTGGYLQSLTQRVGRIVLLELPTWQLLVVAAGVGALWAASLFDWSFVTGRHAFWQFPGGTIGGSENDMATTLVAYFYYVQSPWALPLFYVSALGIPVGTNLIFTDFVPAVGLVGKLVHSITGATVNLYGGYLFLCFVLPGVMMALVLIAARVHYWLAAVLGAIFASATPAMLWRWGHVSLQAHYLLIGALALYLFSLKKPAWRGLAATWVGCLILTYLTNIYLFAMVGTLWLCVLIQRRLDGLSTTPSAVGTGTLTVVAVLIVIALGGQFGAGTPLPFDFGYGYYSMNLASPFVPQSSGLFPWGKRVIDATGGQYEGFNYLGLGLLLASLLVLPAEVGWLTRNIKRHVALFTTFVVLTAFAISHQVYVGHHLLFELPVPYYFPKILGAFRSSGRFFWLICYAQMAMVVILGFRRSRPLIVACLAGAAIVQLLDVQPLREQIIASIAERSDVRQLDPSQVARLVLAAHSIDVVPSFQCSNREQEARTNAQLMLATARANIPINSVYLSRYNYGVTWRDFLRRPSWETLWARRDDYCEQEFEQARGGGGPGDVFVLLSDRPRSEEMVPGVTCSPLSWARYCRRSDPRKSRLR